MEFPKTDKERRELIKQLASKKLGPEDIKPGTGKIPDEFWTMPWPEDPEGLAVRYLIEDRREGR